MGATQPKKVLLSVAETAELLCITSEGVRYLASTGELPVARQEGVKRVFLFFHWTDVLALVQRRRESAQKVAADMRRAERLLLR